MENEAKTVCSVCGSVLPDRGEWKPAFWHEKDGVWTCPVCDGGKPEYRGIGEADLRTTALQKMLEMKSKRIAELEAEVASLRERLAEVDSWKSGEVPEGVDRIQVRSISDPFIVNRINGYWHKHRGWSSIPVSASYMQWRPLKEGE